MVAVHGGSIFERQSFSVAINPADLGDGATNGASISLAGFDGVIYVLHVGAQGAGGTVDLKAQSSSDNGVVDAFADITGANIVQVPDTGDNKIYILDVWRPSELFVRPVVTVGGAGVAVIAGCIAIRYRVTGNIPVALDASVGQVVKFAQN